MTVSAVGADTVRHDGDDENDAEEQRRKKRSMYVAAALKQFHEGKRLTTEYLQVDEIAAYTRTARSSVLQWMRSGRLPSCRPGRRRMAHVADVAALLKQREAQPMAAAS